MIYATSGSTTCAVRALAQQGKRSETTTVPRSEILSMPVFVETGAHDRIDRAAQLALDLTADIRSAGFTGTILPTAFALAENGQPVPFQFDPDPAYHPSQNIKGLLTIFMPGTVPRDTTRTFRLDIGGKVVNGTNVLVSRQTGRQDEGLDAWLIKTGEVEWWWDVEAAAFISIHDPEGKDWVGFSPKPGSKGAGEFRGYPNVVVAKASKGKGNFHPGYTGASTARVVAEGPVRLAVEATTSIDRPFTVLWEFFPSYARARVVRNDIESPFWWLYEGTPGGEFGPFKAILSDGSTAVGERDMPDPEWTYYDSPNSGHVMYFTHTPADDVVELYTTHSSAMALFGMGRGREAPMQRLSPEFGHEFLTGFVESKHFETVKRHILSGMEEIRVTRGAVRLNSAPHRVGITSKGDRTAARDASMDGDLHPVTGEHRGPRRLIIWENDGRGNLIPMKFIEASTSMPVRARGASTGTQIWTSFRCLGRATKHCTSG